MDFVGVKCVMKRTVPQLTVQELHSAMLAGGSASEAMSRCEPRADRVEKQQAAIKQLVLVGRDALRDERAAIYLRTQSTEMLEVHQSLLEAIASVPLVYGESSPLDHICALGQGDSSEARPRSHMRMAALAKFAGAEWGRA